jgi:DNA-binding beta-propeller fold protein YncE
MPLKTRGSRISGVLAATLWIGASVTAQAAPSGSLLVPEVDSNTVAVIDGATNRVVNRFTVPLPASRPAVMARTPDGSKVYIDNFGLLPASVTVLDLKHNTQRTIAVASVPLGAFMSNDGKEVYLPEAGFTVEVMNVATDTVVRSLRFAAVPVGAIPGPDGALYVGFADGRIGAYDPVTGQQIRAPIATGGVAPFWYTFTKDGKKLYVDTVNSIGVIDVANWRLTSIIPTSLNGVYTPAEPGAFTSILSPDGTKLYVSVFGGSGVRIYDVATDRLRGVIPTAGSAVAVIFSDDGTRGYISDLGASTAAFVTPLGEGISFLNLVTLGWLGNGQIIAFDPATDRIVGAPVVVRPGPGIGAWIPAAP